MFSPTQIRQTITVILMVFVILAGAVLPVAAESQPNQNRTTDDANLTPPGNDNFANAQLLFGASGTANGSTASGTHEGGEPVHAFNRGGASVWYKYVAPSAGIVNFNTTNSNFDTLMAVYKGTSLSDAKLVAANDDTIALYSFVNVGANAGDTFYIAIDGFYGSGSFASGNVVLNYGMSNVAANDNFANAELLDGASGKLITTSNVGASREAGEPIMFGNAGGRSLWYKWVAPAGALRSYTFTFEGTKVDGNQAATILCGIYTGTALNNLTFKIFNNRTGLNEMTVTPTPGETLYLSVDGTNFGGAAELETITLNYGITKSTKMADFDRDNRADIAVFRPSTGTWYSIDSVTDTLRSAQFGANGDIPVLADQGFDGKPDYSVYRPSTGTWYVSHSEGYSTAFAWGLPGDIPLVYHSQFYRFPAVYRPSTGWWYQYNAVNGYSDQWGAPGDRVAYADYMGFGIDNMVAFRPSTGTWYINYGGLNFISVRFGLSGDIPVMADYDGDGKSDIAVFRPSNATWYILRSSDNSVFGAQWGLSNDIPQPADYDGDGKADIAVFRSGTWYIRQSSNNGFRAVQFGQAGDIPVTTPTS